MVSWCSLTTTSGPCSLELDEWLADMTPGVVATWNGAAFDLPYLATRARLLGVPLGLQLELDPALVLRHGPLPGHDGAYRATWHHHTHLDAYRVFRSDVGRTFGLSCSLKSVAGLVGLQPVDADAVPRARASSRRAVRVRRERRALHPRARPTALGHSLGRHRSHEGGRGVTADAEGAAPRRRGTSTSNFGVGKRESHDASDFYARFVEPAITEDDHVHGWLDLDTPFVIGDSRDMTVLPDSSVALVVTSPPYFVGKDYERDIERNEIPRSYAEYLEMLTAVFTECTRVLEPGGRIAVNVANLGRKPYRSLSADVVHILQDRLKLLLRGEVIWQKGKGSTGSCAWGTFRSPANPVLRDITERVIIASKGRFDRAQSREQRRAHDPPLPHIVTATSDEFMEATLDVWEIDAESARRVGHPAPFPVGLPERLIHLYTYEDDLVLDPFMGSGTTLVAAAKTGRRYVGYDLDPAYADIARKRVEGLLTRSLHHDRNDGVSTPAVPPQQLSLDPRDFQARAVSEGKAVQDIAQRRLEEAGFTILKKNARLKGLGLTMNFVAADQAAKEWYFDVSGAFTSVRPGLMRTDTVWKCLGRAHVLANHEIEPVVFLTSNLPKRGTDGDRALRNATPAAFFDALEIFSDDDFERLSLYARGGRHEQPLPGFWTENDLE